jgi:Putative transposase
MEELLAVGYYHLVFTIPQELNAMCLKNKKILFGILFKAASQTVLELANDPKHLGAKTGLLAVLHTWGQNMMEHPHLHCIMPAGGLSADRQHWVHVNKKGDFFVHYKVISRKFRGKFLDQLNQAWLKGGISLKGELSALSGKKAFNAFLSKLYKKEWVVNIQKPIGKPEKVLEYLSRYVFRVAITERRINKVKDRKVHFSWKDYRQGNFCFKEMRLDIDEFIRRFLLHALPKGFFKVRYFGIFSSRFRTGNIVLAKKILEQETTDKQAEILEDGGIIFKKQDTVWLEIMQMIKNYKKPNCPVCKKGRMCFAGPDYPKNGWEEG